MAQSYAPMIQQMMLEFQNQRLESAERIARSILRVNSKDLVALQVQGLCMAMQGRIKESIEPFSKASNLDSKNPEILMNLGKAQHQSERYSDAAATFEKLNKIVPNNPQILTDLGTSYAKLRRYQEAADLYDKAILIDQSCFLAWSNYGNLLAEQSLSSKALEYFERAIKLNPKYPEAWTSYGNALYDLGRFDESLIAHESALSLNPNYPEAWINHGNTLLELRQIDKAYESYKNSYSLNPELPYLIGQLLNAKLSQCIWNEAEPTVSQMLALINQDKAVSVPFVLLQTPASLDLQMKCAQIFSADRYPRATSKKISIKNNSSIKKIRIGYFSADFKNHPVGILMQNLMSFHDRSKFEIFGIFLNKETGDDVENNLKSSFDDYINLNCVDDFKAKSLILDLGLDIAIDLNGHTAGARTSLFVNFVAPLQIMFLGYAGTSGCDCYDFLIADVVTIPPQHEKFYTEKVARLPNSFFPVDTSIGPDEFGDLPTKASQHLPDNAFIFTCFNNSYKISPQVFDVWMRCLQLVPNSVIWLSSATDIVMKNLQQEAWARNINPDRIIFADRVPSRRDHLSRLRLADLFLDTPNYNAHATAGDALWAGVPLLTQIGETFAGRVAASQLMALGMPELIANTQDEYFYRAIELANNPQLLSKLRTKLQTNRSSAPLFDTKQYVANLEALYQNIFKEKAQIN